MAMNLETPFVLVSKGINIWSGFKLQSFSCLPYLQKEEQKIHNGTSSPQVKSNTI